MVPSLKSQTISLFTGKVVAYLVMAGIPIILVRMLSPDQFGVYRQVLFLYAVLIPVFRFQFPESLYYFYPRKKDTIHRYLSQTVTLLFLTGMVGSGLFIIAGLIFKLLPSGLTVDFVIPLAALLMIESVASLIEHIFVLEKKPMLTILSNAGFSLLRLILVVGAVLTFGDVIGMVFALIVWGAIRLTVTLVYLYRRYPMIRIGFAGRVPLREQLNYVLPLAIGGVIGLIGAQIDKGIISGYMSAKDFAIYSIGSLGILSAIKLLYISIGNVFVPRFGELGEENDFVSIRLLWHRMITINAMVTMPVVSFCIVDAEPIISVLYTKQYLASAELWRLNMLVLFIQMVGFGYIPKALGRTRAIFMGNLMRFIVSIPLSILLITKYGLMGGAIAFVLGFWANGLIQLRECKRSIGAPLAGLLPWEKLLRITLVCIISAVSLKLLPIDRLNDFYQLCLGVIYFFPVIILLFLLFNIVTIDELQFLFKKKAMPSMGKMKKSLPNR